MKHKHCEVIKAWADGENYTNRVSDEFSERNVARLDTFVRWLCDWQEVEV